jgi:Flp pilus assembly pilin Flp
VRKFDQLSHFTRCIVRIGMTTSPTSTHASNPAKGRARLQLGQGMVEYALILVLVSVVVIVILITQGGTMYDMFSNISATLHRDAGI